MTKSFVVGVAGGTASGKSTLVEMLQRTNPTEVSVLRLDDYYLDSGHVPLDERGQLNFDQLAAFDMPLIESHLETLRSGKRIEMPTYDFGSHARSGTSIILEPTRFILVEGIIALAVESMRMHYDLGVFVVASEEVRFRRRLRRDIEQRSRTEDSVREQWENGVKDFHDTVVEPSKEHADLVIQSTRFSAAVELLATSVFRPDI